MPFDMPDSYEHCGAKTRNGTPCKAPKVKGRNRCRKHGGATPRGAKSPHFRHGFYAQNSDMFTRLMWMAIQRDYKRKLETERLQQLEADRPRREDYGTEKGYRQAVDQWITTVNMRLHILSTMDVIPPQEAQALYEAHDSVWKAIVEDMRGSS